MDNDSKITSADSIESLIAGAHLLAEGRQQGLTDDQTLQVFANKSRRNQSEQLNAAIRNARQ